MIWHAGCNRQVITNLKRKRWTIHEEKIRKIKMKNNVHLMILFSLFILSSSMAWTQNYLMTEPNIKMRVEELSFILMKGKEIKGDADDK